MQTLRSYLSGKWTSGGAKTVPLHNPSTEEVLCEAASGGWDEREAIASARQAGAALREMSFAERGELLAQLSKLIHANRDALITLAIANGGNTRGDAKFDIDGASGTLMAYAEIAKAIGKEHFLLDGEATQLTRSVRFFGQHIAVPRHGVAVHVNAFNFPAWGLGEKLACALAAGMPVIAKPATATALVAHRLVELITEAKILPAAALSLIIGDVGELLSHLDGQDVLAFTGSSDTAKMLRGNPQVVARSVRVNVEADSLNAAVLGPDAERGSEAYAMFVADVARDMTQKTGQKCTAIRRVLVPESLVDAVREDLIERLAATKVGNPALEDVTMGPVATARQHKDVQAGIARLLEESKRLTPETVSPIGVDAGRGYFIAPTLLESDAKKAARVHAEEVFGPVSTLIVYSGEASEAVSLIARGGGGLVSSVYADDRAFLKTLAIGLAPHHGRLFLGSSKLSGHAVGPGTVLPQLVHGGPGRAGGGEELGGLRGLGFYMQRTAVAGDRPILDAIFARQS